MEQKLVTIYLNSHGIKKRQRKAYGMLEEHLTGYLKDGWRVKQLEGIGGGGTSGGDFVGGWVVVLLEKETPA